MEPILKLDAHTLESLIVEYKPTVRHDGFHIEALQLGQARIRYGVTSDMLRPGNRVSGPSLFAVADIAMYACVLAHIGPQPMAVTSDMTMHFLRGANPADLVCEARLLRLGRRLAVMQATIRSVGDTRVVAEASGSYALPLGHVQAQT